RIDLDYVIARAQRSPRQVPDDHDAAVAVAEEDVRRAVAIPVGHLRDLPGRVDREERRGRSAERERASRVLGERDEGDTARRMAEEHVRLPIAVEVPHALHPPRRIEAEE